MVMSRATSYILLERCFWEKFNFNVIFCRNYHKSFKSNDFLCRISCSSYQYHFPPVNPRQLHCFSGKQICGDVPEPRNNCQLHFASKYSTVNRLRKYGLSAAIPGFLSPETQRIRKCSTVKDEQDSSCLGLDPYKLVALEMKTLANDIKMKLQEPSLKTMVQYSFQGEGKKIRPLVALLMSKACNISNNLGDSILENQKIVAIVAEMFHTATLVHDDVIDGSDTRRGQPSLNSIYGQKKPILVGDYIISRVCATLASTRSPEAISILISILGDLISGELMQLGSEEDEEERFSNYLKKSFMKTASLIAKTCQVVALLGKCNEEMTEKAYQYGKNLGIAWQLIDDLLDFISSDMVMGKPTAADLKLGLATAPVLFAAQEYPALKALIMRRFSEEGDVEQARYVVTKSDGIQQTKLLALQHTNEAIKCLQDFVNSDAKSALIHLAKMLLERKK